MIAWDHQVNVYDRISKPLPENKCAAVHSNSRCQRQLSRYDPLILCIWLTFPHLVSRQMPENTILRAVLGINSSTQSGFSFSTLLATFTSVHFPTDMVLSQHSARKPWTHGFLYLSNITNTFFVVWNVCERKTGSSSNLPERCFGPTSDYRMHSCSNINSLKMFYSFVDDYCGSTE